MSSIHGISKPIAGNAAEATGRCEPLPRSLTAARSMEYMDVSQEFVVFKELQDANCGNQLQGFSRQEIHVKNP